MHVLENDKILHIIKVRDKEKSVHQNAKHFWSEVGITFYQIKQWILFKAWQTHTPLTSKTLSSRQSRACCSTVVKRHWNQNMCRAVLSLTQKDNTANQRLAKFLPTQFSNLKGSPENLKHNTCPRSLNVQGSALFCDTGWKKTSEEGQRMSPN